MIEAVCAVQMAPHLELGPRWLCRQLRSQHQVTWAPCRPKPEGRRSRRRARPEESPVALGHQDSGLDRDWARPAPLPWPCEQPASARWSGAQASRRPTKGADRKPGGTRRMEGHHASSAQRVHLLGRGCQAAVDPRAPHSPDPGGAGGRPASALLLARVQAPRPHRQLGVGWAPPAMCTATCGLRSYTAEVGARRQPRMAVAPPRTRWHPAPNGTFGHVDISDGTRGGRPPSRRDRA